MKQKTILLSLAVLLSVVLIVSIPLFAAQTPWTYLGEEDYQLTDNLDGTAIVFNALQDSDKEKIQNVSNDTMNLEGVQIGTGGAVMGKLLKDSRPDFVSPLQFKKVGKDNSLEGLIIEQFDISYDDQDGTKSAKLAKLYVDGKAALAPADPEFAGYSLIASPDKSKYLLPTDSGLWLINTDKKNSVKLSRDSFNGKNRKELMDELKVTIGELDGPAVIWWNEAPVFNSDSTKIAYMTNRDCTASLGSSIWLYDITSGVERPLISNIAGENYRCIGWADNSHLIYQKFEGAATSYHIADLNGSSIAIRLDGINPIVLCTDRNLLAFTPNYSLSNEICVGKINIDDGSISLVYEKQLAGTLRSPYSFSANGAKLAYAFAPAEDNTVQSIAVADMTSKEESILKDAPVSKRLRPVLCGFSWTDSDRLIVNISKTDKNLNVMTTWLYDLKGGNK